MIALDLLGTAPTNQVQSSQRIYETNPILPDPNAPAPTSAVSYYPEAPGFVEDPREIDVNRDFGMNRYAPQWDTEEQAMLGIDVWAGRDRRHTGGGAPCVGAAGATDDRCPVRGCGAQSVMRCKCSKADTKYKCGHESNICPRHKCVNVGPSDHASDRCTCPPLTHCTDMVGAMPSFEQLKPYFLTDYPSSAADLAQLWDHYLRAFDAFTASINSIWHPISTVAVWTSMRAARALAIESWKKSGIDAIIAVQMLAGIMGWFNANYKSSDGSIKWAELSEPVNAGVIDGAQGAAKLAVEGARAAGKAVDDLAAKAASAAKTAWWVMVGLVAAGIGAAGLLLWKLIGSDAGRAVAAHYLPTRRHLWWQK